MVLMALAATLVGLSLLLVIGYNWSEMSDALKVTAVFGSLIVTHAAGAGLRWRRGLRRESEILFFIGCIVYGSGIWLLAQIFNISSEDASGFWWWAIGVLPFALVLDTLLLHFLFVALMAIWAGTEVLSYSDLGFWLFGPSLLPGLCVQPPSPRRSRTDLGVPKTRPTGGCFVRRVVHMVGDPSSIRLEFRGNLD